ncbi:MAG: hypothetical protein IOC66_33920, partial [Burkholderia sp.]|nr:hypothetical protein [Burkholderia sp.]
MGVPEKYARPGEARVTWLRDPLASKHVKQADGYGHAVDLLPAPYDWKETKPFDLVAKAIEKATAIVNERRAKDGHAPVSVRWGADWDKDGKPRERGESDSPHFELA